MGEAAVKEPSMEDILASIRKIVSEDEQPAGRAKPSAGTPGGRSFDGATGISSGSGRTAPPAFSSRPVAETGSFARFAREAVDRPAPSGPPIARPSFRREEDAAPVRSAPRDSAPFGAPRSASASVASFSRQEAPRRPVQEAAPAQRPMAERPLDQRPADHRSTSSGVGRNTAGPATAAQNTAAQSSAEKNRRTDFQAPPKPSIKPAAGHSSVFAPARPQTSRPEASRSETVRPELPRAETPRAEASRREAPRPETSVPVAARAPAAPERRSAADREVEAFRGALTSPSTERAVRESFDKLKRKTMDDLDAKVEALLRPMLREWLDENLPRVVERMVAAEIDRLTGKG